MTVVAPRPNLVHVACSGEHDRSNVEDVLEIVAWVIDRTDEVVVDLTAVTFLDASFAGMLYDAYRYAQESDCRFRVEVRREQTVARVVQIVGVFELLRRGCQPPSSQGGLEPAA